MAEILIQLEPDKYYHIYNHATGKENLFENNSDYNWFLKKIKKYILPVSDVHAYCLMPNHFHLLVRIKSGEDVRKVFNEKNKAQLKIDDLKYHIENDMCNSLSKYYSNFFNAYAKYFNFSNGRRGTLFKRAFRRKLIKDHDYLKQVICYIHQNPVKAGLCNHPGVWKYSSYNAITNNGETLINKKAVISLFDDLENFIFCNSTLVEIEEEE